MLNGKTESGARMGSKLPEGGTAPGISAMVEDLRSEECIPRRCVMTDGRALIDVATGQ